MDARLDAAVCSGAAVPSFFTAAMLDLASMLIRYVCNQYVLLNYCTLLQMLINESKTLLISFECLNRPNHPAFGA